jgi:N6-adenosine-specific RNA methylase IME4
LKALPRTVVADPPWWPSLHKNTRGRTEGPYRAGPQRYYPLMNVADICLLVPSTAPKAHLYLWCLNQHVDWGYQVARAWGFEPQQMLTWCKPVLGTGQFQSNSEQVLVCRKGGPVGNAFGRTGGTYFMSPRGRHSAKPDSFFEIVERVSPGPYLEMFARSRRPGWLAFGNEIESDAGVLVK